MTPDQVEKLPKHRKDWLEIWGNQWKMRPDTPEPMTEEERAALDAALNPFANPFVNPLANR